MRPLTIFRHIACEGPGYLADVLERHAVPWRLVRVDEGEGIPDTLDDSSGLVFMGGPMSVNDPLPWIEQEMRLIRMAQAAN
ncbi:MAG: type 1 glutamine amidotransferase, partial [Gammaproteobacteria bacterium]|nr:type 1 glutamine amidotransferase [Gammaproteobacteria bacterium]